MEILHVGFHTKSKTIFCVFADKQLPLHKCDPESVIQWLGNSQERFHNIYSNVYLSVQISYLENNQIMAYRKDKVFNLLTEDGRKQLKNYDIKEQALNSKETKDSSQEEVTTVLSDQRQQKLKQTDKELRIKCWEMLNTIDVFDTQKSIQTLQDALGLMQKTVVLEQLVNFK
ncbi:Hypothetical_protein [Hexamita inflata]|uniref:Hypothetical_protein n=1 Tax=Hexamita inflata TaxID=28002 RepID=A0AA86QU14_9EUKA|nr:Hypothetical protein HINF_LOCUS12405 [Hexamita inflata]CAI9964148.1 Hypothetical protein HINF_LOCUS51793 [Hexamita inflata]